MSLPPLTKKVIDGLAASMQAAAERMEKQTARIAEIERDLADCESSHEELDTKLELWAETIAAVEALSDEQVRWFQNSGPFRHVCKAEMARRKL